MVVVASSFANRRIVIDVDVVLDARRWALLPPCRHRRVPRSSSSLVVDDDFGDVPSRDRNFLREVVAVYDVVRDRGRIVRALLVGGVEVDDGRRFGRGRKRGGRRRGRLRGIHESSQSHRGGTIVVIFVVVVIVFPIVGGIVGTGGRRRADDRREECIDRRRRRRRRHLPRGGRLAKCIPDVGRILLPRLRWRRHPIARG
jgi:hypothetical protein